MKYLYNNLIEPVLIICFFSLFFLEFFNIYNYSSNYPISAGKSSVIILIFLISNFILKHRKNKLKEYLNYSSLDFIELPNEQLAEIFNKLDELRYKKLKKELKMNHKIKFKELRHIIHKKLIFKNIFILLLLFLLSYYINSNSILTKPFFDKSFLTHFEYLILAISFFILLIIRNIYFLMNYVNPNDEFSKYKK